MTYNHEPYIRNALNGFLMQRTTFPFNIVVHDDASTDGTADILRSYQRAYPTLINCVFQAENQYSRNGKAAVFDALQPLVTGKYVAVCEGDDYWLDAKKLQIQARFLEDHPGYAITGHDAIVVDAAGSVLAESSVPTAFRRDFEADDLILGRVGIKNLTRMYRNVLLNYPPERSLVKNGDVFTLSLLGTRGKSHFHQNVRPGVYRVHAGGVWSQLDDRTKVLDNVNTYMWLHRYYQRIGEERYATELLERALEKAIGLASSRTLVLALMKKIARPIYSRARQSLGGSR
jgi:glycosyltransferase involved in cell wall biosynthesis